MILWTPRIKELIDSINLAPCPPDDTVYAPMPALRVEPNDEEMVVSRSHAEQRAKDMFLFFGMKENLPNRVSIDEGDAYTSVYQRLDEQQLMTKYKNNRMIEWNRSCVKRQKLDFTVWPVSIEDA